MLEKKKEAAASLCYMPPLKNMERELFDIFF